MVTFSHARPVKSTRNTTRENRVFSRRNSGAQKCCVSVARPIVAMMLRRTSISSAAKGLNKRTFEDSGYGPMTKYQKVLIEQENVTSTNRGFRTKDHSIATYEQTKKGIFSTPRELLNKMIFIPHL